jgi:hypothetical protein
VAGVGCALAGATALIVGALMLANRCTEIETYTLYDDIYYISSATVCNATYLGVLQLVGGSLLIGAAVCTFTFACGKRYRMYHMDDDDDDNKNNDKENKKTNDPESGIIIPNETKKRGGANDSISHLSMGSGGETTTITTLPNGSIRTERETIRGDGTRMITTTIEEPKTDKGRNGRVEDASSDDEA